MGVLVEVQPDRDEADAILEAAEKRVNRYKAEAPYTIAELKALDDYDEFELDSVEAPENGRATWGFLTTDSTGFGVSVERIKDWMERTGKTPEKGMKGRIYSSGFGSQFHGVDLDGEEVFWHTTAERDAERAQWLADLDRERRDEFAEQKDFLDAEYDKLPEPLQKRIARFRERNPDFRVNDERYEMFCCTEGAKAADAARTAAAENADEDQVNEFWSNDELRAKAYGGDLSESVWSDEPEPYAARWLLWVWALGSPAYDDYEGQKERLGFDDGHTGNTHGAALTLGLHLLLGEEV